MINGKQIIQSFKASGMSDLCFQGLKQVRTALLVKESFDQLPDRFVGMTEAAFSRATALWVRIIFLRRSTWASESSASSIKPAKTAVPYTDGKMRKSRCLKAFHGRAKTSASASGPFSPKIQPQPDGTRIAARLVSLRDGKHWQYKKDA